MYEDRCDSVNDIPRGIYDIEIQSQFECKCDGMLCSLVGHKSYVEMSLYH